jgi:hypothetical protein
MDHIFNSTPRKPKIGIRVRKWPRWTGFKPEVIDSKRHKDFVDWMIKIAWKS